ncbi:hypothetical protein NC651_038749 [Populus alba x Populus x berolinensis]|nr:hypothetical protein NC651_038749 [Populus alba x Populus x berolinensis]
MGDYSNIVLHHDRELQEHEGEGEEEEEALSLCDFPLEGRNEESPNIAFHSGARSSSEPAEFFEFFSDLSSEMRSAEDIIFRGKLVPVKEPYFTPQNHSKEDKQRISFRRRCESLSELQSSVCRSSSSKNNIGLMRNSRSLDYRKLERFSSSKKCSSELDIERSSSSLKSIHAKSDVKKTASKPRWYLLMFGVVKPPTEMNLSDIKSRQGRRNYSVSMFPPVDTDGKKAPVNQSCISKGSCRLLRVLSCKDPASVAVATSFLVPRVGIHGSE